MNLWNKLSISKKFVILTTGAVFILCFILVFYTAVLMKSYAENDINSRMTQVGHIVQNSFKVTSEGILKETKLALGLFHIFIEKEFGSSRFSLGDKVDLINDQGQVVNRTHNLVYNNHSFANNSEFTDKVDKYLEQYTGGEATVTLLVKDKETKSFIRIATSLTDL